MMQVIAAVNFGSRDKCEMNCMYSTTESVNTEVSKKNKSTCFPAITGNIFCQNPKTVVPVFKDQ